jgi:hypothetical protein
MAADLSNVVSLEGCWVTREGERIPIPEMSTRHLLHATALIRRNQAYILEQLKRMHADSVDDALGLSVVDLLMSRHTRFLTRHPHYRRMVSELKCRGVLELIPR